jgi:Arc/MetJ-type ribon-helix-helix transcriptional regulator
MVVQLEPDQEEFLAQGVRSGRFATVDEALREAVGLLKDREIGSAVKRAAGRKSLAQLFAESPFRGTEMEFERNPSPLRPVEF